MKKTLLAFAVILGLRAFSFADVPSKFEDGKIKLAYAAVDNQVAWDEAQKDYFVETMTFSSMTAPVVTILDPGYELNLSTCVILTQWPSFESYTDWMNAHTKAGLSIKIKKMLWEDQFNPVHGTEIGWLEWFLSTLP